MLEEMLDTARSINVPPLSIAVFYMRLGEQDPYMGPHYEFRI